MEEIIKDIEGGQAEEAAEKALLLALPELPQLIDRAGRLGSSHGGTFLTLLYSKIDDKGLRKLIKKAIFHLKTLGLPVEEPRISGESVLRKTEVVREGRALLSNYDPGQTRAVIVAVEMKKKEFVFVHGATHFSKGLEELRTFPLSKDELEKVIRDFTSRALRPMVLAPVSPVYAGFLLEEASSVSGRFSDEVRALKGFLAPLKDRVRKPADIYSFEGRGSVSGLSAEGVLGSDVLGPFSLEWQGLDEDRAKLKEITNPAIVLPPHILQERTESFLKGLLEKEALSSKLHAFKRMLEDTAYLFHSLHEMTIYEGVLDLLKDDEGVMKAFVYFIQKALQKTEEEEREPGVIIDPRSLVRR
jgi:hypothetical protein